MRVALVLPSLDGGGAQRVWVDLAGGLVDRAVEVDLVLVRDEGVLRDRVPSGVRLEFLGGREVSLAVPRLARYLRNRRPDVALPAIPHMNLCTLLAARLMRPRVPVVVAQHNHLSTGARHATLLQDRLTPLLVRLGYPWADGVVAVSEGVADDLATSARLDRRRITVVPNPVTFERIARAAAEPAGHRWLAEKAGPVLLASGRLTGQKDFANLLRALALLDVGTRLIVLGEGGLRADLEALSRRLGVDDRVDFAGFVANPYPFYRAADVFVLSSRWEGLPTVLLEALFLGTPIVATDCPSGPAEILEGGRWGRLVAPSDPESLARAVEATLREGGPAGGPEACARFRTDAATGHYVDVLTAAAGRVAR